ncbi:MAG: LptF/LptG family permease [Rickettsiales bacterium]|jgi:lipopolysaccharide export LptBFGC system permease protein LptF|nr:LptF/LptG family permease [Rickettsiales bacterium]
MKILNRYFAKRLLALFVMLCIILAGLAWMTQILALLRYIVQYGAGVGAFIGMTLLMFPFIISIILPYVVFISVVFVYNQMIADHEIPVMMSAGLSPGQIAVPALRLAVLVMVFHYALTLFIIPDSQKRFYDKQWDLRYGLANMKIQDSTWTQLSPGLVVFVEKARGDNLENLVISDTRNAGDMMVMAAQGRIVKTQRGLSLLTKSGTVQMKTGNLATGSFESLDMDMNLREPEDGGRIKMRQVGTADLVRMDIRKLPKKSRSDFVSEIGNRFLSPLMNILLAMIALVSLLRTSTLRRAASLSVPVAIAGLVVSQSLFMGVINSSGGNMGGIYVFGGALVAALLLLSVALQRGLRHA